MSKPKAPPAPPTAGEQLRSLTQAQIDVAPLQLAAQEEFAPRFAEQRLRFGEEFGPQFARQQLRLEEIISPELVSVRKRLGTALAKRLETPEKLPEEQLERFRSTVRAGQALRGVATSGISAVSEARQLTGITEAAGARVRGEALQFLGRGGGPAFGGIPGAPSFGVSPGTAVGAASQFGQLGLQRFGIQQLAQQQQAQQIGSLGASLFGPRAGGGFDIFGVFGQEQGQLDTGFVGPPAPASALIGPGFFSGSNLANVGASTAAGFAAGGPVGGGIALGANILSSIFL